MRIKDYLPDPGAFVRGMARALDLGALSPAPVGWPEPPLDDAAALISDWEALAGDQRRAWDKLSAELRGTFNGKSSP
ncbi:MAG TPA: hypothetical protein VF092_31485 [Longimicrobium sp.]